MLFEPPVHVVGVGAELGELISPASNADEAGQRNAQRCAQRSIAVSSSSGPELAAIGGQRALRCAATVLRCDQDTIPVDLHLHATIWDRGIDFWSAPCFVRGENSAPGLSVGIDGMSNSVVASLELAARILAGSPDVRSALLTAGDRFGAPGFCHWNTDLDIIYGDAGTGMVLGRQPGLARLISACSWTDASLEGLNRGREPLRRRVDADRNAPLDVGGRKVDWRTRSRVDVRARNSIGISHVVRRCLDDAGLTIDAVNHIYCPFYGRPLAYRHVLEPLGVPAAKTRIDLGAQLGHLGASDQTVALWYDLHRGQVAPGDRVLLIGIGVGMTWTAALLEITDTLADTDPDTTRQLDNLAA